jgi:hypothetical protein
MDRPDDVEAGAAVPAVIGFDLADAGQQVPGELASRAGGSAVVGLPGQQWDRTGDRPRG